MLALRPLSSKSYPDTGIRQGILLIETRLLPALARCYPRSFTFYVTHPTRSILTAVFLLSVGFNVTDSAQTCWKIKLNSWSHLLPTARRPRSLFCRSVLYS